MSVAEKWRRRAKTLSDREVLKAWLRANTEYSEAKIREILKLYDELPEA